MLNKISICHNEAVNLILDYLTKAEGVVCDPDTLFQISVEIADTLSYNSKDDVIPTYKVALFYYDAEGAAHVSETMSFSDVNEARNYVADFNSLSSITSEYAKIVTNEHRAV